MTTPAVALTECLQCIFSQVGRPFCGVEKCKFSQTRPATAKAKVHSLQTLLPDPPLLFSRIESCKARTIRVNREAAGGRAVKSKQPMASCCRAREEGRPVVCEAAAVMSPAPAAASATSAREQAGRRHLRRTARAFLPRAAVRGGGRRKEGGARINTPPAIPMNKCSLVISKQNKELNSPTTRSPAFLRAPPATISLGNHHALVLPTMIMCVVVCPARTGRGAARCSDGQSAARLSSVSSRRGVARSSPGLHAYRRAPRLRLIGLEVAGPEDEDGARRGGVMIQKCCRASVGTRYFKRSI